MGGALVSLRSQLEAKRREESQAQAAYDREASISNLQGQALTKIHREHVRGVPAGDVDRVLREQRRIVGVECARLRQRARLIAGERVAAEATPIQLLPAGA